MMIASRGDAVMGEEQLQKLFLESGNCDQFLEALRERVPRHHNGSHDSAGSSSDEGSEQTVEILET
jgi:hypothetical protein